MIRATYTLPGIPYYKWIKRGVIYDFSENKKIDNFFDIWFEGEYITWCSKSWFEKCFTTIADLRNQRIDEILND